MLGIEEINNKFLGDFKNFIIGNNILTTSACVVIAFSTGTMIRSLVGDLMLPAIYKLVLQKIKFASGAFAPISKSNFDNFLKEFVSWIFVILLTFILIEYVVRRHLLKTENSRSLTTGETKKPAPFSSSASTTETFKYY